MAAEQLKSLKKPTGRPVAGVSPLGKGAGAPRMTKQPY